MLLKCIMMKIAIFFDCARNDISTKVHTQRYVHQKCAHNKNISQNCAHNDTYNKTNPAVQQKDFRHVSLYSSTSF